MSITDPSILSRLNLARTPKKKEAPKPLEKRTPLKKTGKPKPRSKKQSKVMQVLSTLYKAFLANHDECEIKSPVCTGQVETVHHTKGRSESVVYLQKYWKRSCSACNIYVEDKDQWARENGHKENRHGNDQLQYAKDNI